MYILGREEMQAMDRYTMDEIGLPGVVLMENAGARVTEEILRHVHVHQKSALILAGSGQNGGDGFVIGRRLIEAGWDVHVCLLAPPHKIKGDARVHFQVYVKRDFPLSVIDDDRLPELRTKIEETPVIIDAMLGTGIRGKTREPYAQVIRWLNRHAEGKEIIAVDIPSGVCSNTGQVEGEAVRATRTVTFVCPKKGFFLPPGMTYVGEWKAVDISVPPSLVRTLHFDAPRLSTPQKVREALPKRVKHGHKGTFGHVFIVGGSQHFVGAPVFSARAALKSGAGLVTMAVPDVIYTQVSSSFPSAMFQPWETQNGFFAAHTANGIRQSLSNYDAVVVGPGLGRWDDGSAWMEQLLSKPLRRPLVLDADGLYHVASHKALLARQNAPIIVTPHPGEMARLLKTTVQAIETNRLQVAKDLAREHQVYVLLKGYRSIIAAPDGEVWVNPTGNDALATGGSGDVLAGILASFLAQGAAPLEAMIAAAYLHGFTAEQLSRQNSAYSITVEEIIAGFGQALKSFVSAY